MALISTLTDNFDDNSIDGAKWADSSFSDPDGTPGTISETGGTIQLSSTNFDGTQTATCETAASYDFTGSSVSIKLVSYTSTASGYVVRILNLTTSTHECNIEISNDGVDASFGATVDSGGLQGTTTYNSSTHKYFRIREASGTFYWDWSTNGGSWTNFYSVSNPLGTLTSTSCRMMGVTFGLVGGNNTSILDDFNILPSATATGIMTTRSNFWGDI